MVRDIVRVKRIEPLYLVQGHVQQVLDDGVPRWVGVYQ